MKKNIDEKINLVKNLCEPIVGLDVNLVNEIIDKMLVNKDYEGIINVLNNLYDFSEIQFNIVDKLISTDNRECVSVFLSHEDCLYFLSTEEINKLRNFLNVYEVNIKLKESYDYYYKLLFNQNVRIWKNDFGDINDKFINYKCTRNNKLLNIKLKEYKDGSVVVSCIIYTNYILSKEEQILKCIDYINEYGFNIDNDLTNNCLINIDNERNC